LSYFEKHQNSHEYAKILNEDKSKQLHEEKNKMSMKCYDTNDLVSSSKGSIKSKTSVKLGQVDINGLSIHTAPMKRYSGKKLTVYFLI